jgi:type IV pilus assembly protein PilC
MSMMLRSGLDLIGALQTIKKQTSSRALARVLTTMIPAISGGQGLAAAMADASIFPPIAVQLVSVGEETGKLSQVLEQAAKHMAQRRTAIAEVRVALAYPVIVALAAVTIAVYLVFAVIPELEKFLNAMGRKLPQMTQSLVDLSRWCQVNGATTLVSLITMLIGLALVTRWPPGRLFIDRWCLRLPLIGSILRLSGTATLASSLAVMIRSGIKLLEALTVIERLQANRFLAAHVAAARHSVVRGEDFAKTLATPHGYMPMLTSMLEVAQRTGQLDATLDDVAKFCEVELQAKIKRLSMLVEPAIIVVAGGIVGYVYMAFFMALISAGGHVK